MHASCLRQSQCAFPCWSAHGCCDPIPPSYPQNSLLAEIGTVQLEFRYLSKHVGDPIFARLVRGGAPDTYA
jgi:hypothetical protein